MALTQSDLSDLLAALKAGEMTDTIRRSLEWILQELIEAEAINGDRSSPPPACRHPHHPTQRPSPPAVVHGGRRCRAQDTQAPPGSLFPSLLERRRRIDRACSASSTECRVGPGFRRPRVRSR